MSPGKRTAATIGIIICALGGMLCPCAGAADQKPAPQVTQVGMVSPGILSVTIRDGSVQVGQRARYVRQPGDVIVEDNFPQRWLVRNGVPTGAIGGKNKDILLPFDKVQRSSLQTSALQAQKSFRISSPNDPAYKAGVTPQTVFRKTRPHNMGRTGPFDFVGADLHTLYLRLPHPLREGSTYTLAFQGLPLKSQRLVMKSSRLVSEAIHVSQIGFRPDDPAKVAFLSCWMGDGGGIKYSAGLPFQVIDVDSCGVAYKGVLKLSKAGDDQTEDVYKRNYNKTDVYIADFSGLKRQGRYAVVVPGIGCSLTFKVDRQAWYNPFRTSVRGLYHQRSGIALGPPYTSFVRPRDFHPDDGVVIYESKTPIIDTGNGPLGYDVEPTNFVNLTKGRTGTTMSNAWGGYHDAGDWDRRVQHLASTRNLLDLLDMFPGWSSRASLNIPKSAEKLPDMLSEALFGLDVYRRMQTKEGGIRGGIESAEHPRFGETSWQESLTIMAYAPDAWSSYWYAGTAARAARVLERYNQSLSREYRESALRAMEWAESQQAASPKPVSTGTRLIFRLAALCAITALSGWTLVRRAPGLHGARRTILRFVCILAIPLSLWRCAAVYADPGYPADLHRAHLIRDARNYAAAELLRLTGDARWNEVFRATTQFNQPGAVLAQWGSHDQADAAWVYARIKGSGVDEQLRGRCLEVIRRTADERLASGEATGFKWTKYPWRPFGIGIPAVPDAMPLIWAHYLTGDSKYLRAVVLATQFGAGANPINMCFTTGVGQSYPQHPLHLDSRLSGQRAPEGITVLGPMDVTNSYFEGDWGRKLLSPYCYPTLQEWPPVESYMDVFWNALICEFTVHDSIAPNLMYWGYLSARGAR